uniref:Uncharacterized protein n=1 Tax=Chromera velia CCMP2878 TaxID=1169474 RepID=A0A0G4IDI2_9ALVE|eukprot:Cvel_13456.t1-p1 / transcript=Cvel_13456.t1 / gene=Cvel_13456 / organism=Chromera_velia_CCMP2878 / gene_product=hypothetical protein / transcript_product=hypothetical protein / location=Cvel_scaffold919:55364-55864(-) / protein_length=167 / sequence_SO=supercontig / SO=protein_coding / is_pseudo=false
MRSILLSMRKDGTCWWILCLLTSSQEIPVACDLAFARTQSVYTVGSGQFELSGKRGDLWGVVAVRKGMSGSLSQNPQTIFCLQACAYKGRLARGCPLIVGLYDPPEDSTLADERLNSRRSERESGGKEKERRQRGEERANEVSVCGEFNARTASKAEMVQTVSFAPA